MASPEWVIEKYIEDEGFRNAVHLMCEVEGEEKWPVTALKKALKHHRETEMGLAAERRAIELQKKKIDDAMMQKGIKR